MVCRARGPRAGKAAGQKGDPMTPAEKTAVFTAADLALEAARAAEKAAREGVTIVNKSSVDPIVMLKHFGPENPDMKL